MITVLLCTDSDIIQKLMLAPIQIPLLCSYNFCIMATTLTGPQATTTQ